MLQIDRLSIYTTKYDEFVKPFKTPGKNQEKPKEADQTKVAMEDIDIKKSEDLINLRKVMVVFIDLSLK